MQEGDAFTLCKVKAGLKLLITAAICSHACPCINATSRLSRHNVCALGRDGWMCSSLEELPALELDTGHPISLQVRLQMMDLSECLPKERVSHREVCRGAGGPHLRHCSRDFFGTGALLAFSPRALSAD